MILREERELVRAYGVKMLEKRLTTGTAGNISVFNRKEGLYAMSPSSMDYHEITAEDVVVIDLEGHVVEGTRRPSIEHVMHRSYYKGRTDINAVVHTHSPYATAASCLGKSLPAVHFMLSLCGAYELPCAKFAPPGTEELAEITYQAMQGYKAVLLQNHGLIAGAETIEQAMYIAEEMESMAQLYFLAKGTAARIHRQGGNGHCQPFGRRSTAADARRPRCLRKRWGSRGPIRAPNARGHH